MACDQQIRHAVAGLQQAGHHHRNGVANQLFGHASLGQVIEIPSQALSSYICASTGRRKSVITYDQASFIINAPSAKVNGIFYGFIKTAPDTAGFLQRNIEKPASQKELLAGRPCSAASAVSKTANSRLRLGYRKEKAARRSDAPRRLAPAWKGFCRARREIASFGGRRKQKF